MASRAISTPSVIINNIAIAIVPNSLKYTEGLGESVMRTQSAGGGTVDVVYSINAESRMSKLSFEILNTADNIDLARGWKTNENQNAISLVDSQSNLSRNFANMALTSDYEVNLGADTTISIEFMGNGAV